MCEVTDLQHKNPTVVLDNKIMYELFKILLIMTIEEAKAKIAEDTKSLYRIIDDAFKLGMNSPAFTSEHKYEELIINIFRYFLMSMFPDGLLVTEVVGDDYKKVNHSFYSWYMALSNGNISHWMEVNKLKDADMYSNGALRYRKRVYYLRYHKALKLKNIPNNEVLTKMMHIVEAKLLK